MQTTIIVQPVRRNGSRCFIATDVTKLWAKRDWSYRVRHQTFLKSSIKDDGSWYKLWKFKMFDRYSSQVFAQRTHMTCTAKITVVRNGEKKINRKCAVSIKKYKRANTMTTLKTLWWHSAYHGLLMPKNINVTPSCDVTTTRQTCKQQYVGGTYTVTA